jgi:hypothetical protein
MAAHVGVDHYMHSRPVLTRRLQHVRACPPSMARSGWLRCDCLWGPQLACRQSRREPQLLHPTLPHLAHGGHAAAAARPVALAAPGGRRQAAGPGGGTPVRQGAAPWGRLGAAHGWAGALRGGAPWGRLRGRGGAPWGRRAAAARRRLAAGGGLAAGGRTPRQRGKSMRRSCGAGAMSPMQHSAG